MMFAREPAVGLVDSKAEKESTTVEQSSTPKTPVASNTMGSVEEAPTGRWTSKAITFKPSTTPEVGRMIWNLEKMEES